MNGVKRLVIFLTKNCNLRCDYCYFDKTNIILDYDIFRDGLDFFLNSEGFLKKIWIQNIETIDGLKLSKYFDILFYLLDKYNYKKIILNIDSNGVIYKSEIERYKFINLSFSLDSKDNYYRGINIDLVYRNFKKYKIKGFNLKINKTLYKDDIDEYKFRQDIIYLYKKFGSNIYLNFALGKKIGIRDYKGFIYFYKKLYNVINVNIDLFLNDFMRYSWYVPIYCCPYSSLYLGFDGKIYNCELIGLNSNYYKDIYVYDVKNNMFNDRLNKFIKCTYDLDSENCINESCSMCGKVCTTKDLILNKLVSSFDKKILEIYKGINVGIAKIVNKKYKFTNKSIVFNIFFCKNENDYFLKYKDTLLMFFNYLKIFLLSLKRFGFESIYISVNSDNKIVYNFLNSFFKEGVIIDFLDNFNNNHSEVFTITYPFGEIYYGNYNSFEEIEKNNKYYSGDIFSQFYPYYILNN